MQLISSQLSPKLKKIPKIYLDLASFNYFRIMILHAWYGWGWEFICKLNECECFKFQQHSQLNCKVLVILSFKIRWKIARIHEQSIIYQNSSIHVYIHIMRKEKRSILAHRNCVSLFPCIHLLFTFIYYTTIYYGSKIGIWAGEAQWQN